MSPDDQITDGMLQWEPGTLSTQTLTRIAIDAVADIWGDCYRRESSQANRVNMFREKMMYIIRCATGRGMRVTE